MSCKVVYNVICIVTHKQCFAFDQLINVLCKLIYAFSNNGTIDYECTVHTCSNVYLELYYTYRIIIMILYNKKISFFKTDSLLHLILNVISLIFYSYIYHYSLPTSTANVVEIFAVSI